MSSELPKKEPAIMPAQPESTASLTAVLKVEAHRLGFDLAGAAPAVAPPGLDHFQKWLADSYAGEMHYLADRVEAYEHPRHVLEGVRSILMLATGYRTVEPVTAEAGQATVSRYAWGLDYHELIYDRLRKLADFHRQIVPTAKVRGIVDTAPFLERDFGQLAGLGWIGKNTLLLNKHLGSWFFLAALLTSEELQYDAPLAADYCGSCRACLDACPTGALVAPYRLDARRCISYLTIELRGLPPADLRAATGDRLFGCDACQEACPWNRRAATTSETAEHCTPLAPREGCSSRQSVTSTLDKDLQPRPGMNPVDLADLFELDVPAFRERFRHTPLWRAKRRGILRNAAIALGNRPDAKSLPALLRGLNDNEPLVRAAAAWALGRCADPRGRSALIEWLPLERNAMVRTEIEAAVSG